MSVLGPALVRGVARSVGALPDDVVRGLGQVLFTRTRKELAAALRDVRETQERRLLGVLRRNADTEVGRRYGFADIASADEYRARVPLTTWDDMAPLVDRMIAGEQRVLVDEEVFFYATTSGTTGKRKLIPVTPSFVAECRASTKLLLRTSLLSFPGFLRGKRLTMRSPHVEDLGGGALAGSITVALSGGLSETEGAFDAVPNAVYRVADFETRYRLCLRFALQEDVSLVSAINPSTLLLFARTLEQHAEGLAAALERGTLGEGLVLDDDLRATLTSRARRDPEAARRVRGSLERHGRARMRDVFPRLCGLVCWKGGSAPWYLSQLPSSYGELPVLDYGYAASEGCFGAPLSTDGAASLLVPHGHFVELVPEDEIDAARAGQGRGLLLHEAEIGRRYYVVATTAAGLYRYDMNDVVEVTGKLGGAPLVVFRHKGGNMSSLTGEKLGESHVVRAMDRAAQGERLAGFTLAPWLPSSDDAPPGYLLALDEEAPLDDDAREALAARFDRALREENSEYEAKRASLRLASTRAVALPSGAIARHRSRRVAAGAPDAHVKVPHLSPDGRLLLDLGLDDSAPDLAARLPCRVSA